MARDLLDDDGVSNPSTHPTLTEVVPTLRTLGKIDVQGTDAGVRGGEAAR